MSRAASYLPFRLGALAVLVAWLSVTARAEQPALEFLHAAQDRGYGEVAIAFLEQLQNAGRLPPALAQTYDLELSRSYRAAVAEAFNAAEAETRLAKAQTHLDKFLKEHPEHQEVARAMESWGDIGLDRGLERIRQAAATKDTAAKEKLLTAARADLAESRPRFVDATARFHEQYVKLTGASGAEGSKRPVAAANRTRQRRQAEAAAAQAELAWLECRFKSAKIDFYTALTYADPKEPKRTTALNAAAKAFDEVFQSYRESLVGLHAHLWHGRAADELDNNQLALDIYDEVLATSPDGRERESGLEPLFAQAQYYRLLVIKRQSGPEAFLADANEWLELRRAWRKFDAYQGVMLEVAKTNLAGAAQLSGSRKTGVVQSSLAMLADVAKVRGEFQQEAILLRRQYAQGGDASGTTADPATAKIVDEALALGETAMENHDWSGAVGMFERALALKVSTTDAKRIEQATSRLDQARYQLAAALYAGGKFNECLAAAEKIVEARPDGTMSAPSAALAVSAALTMYAQAEDKPPALARLEKIAQATIQRWPDKAEADDARIALGQASLVRGEFAAAAAAFEAVNPRSLRYPAAMFLAGQTNWRLYLAARSRPAADRAALDAQRSRAQTQLQTSLDAQRKAAESNPSGATQLVDTELLLAEVRLDAGDAKGSAELIAPLAESLRKQKPQPLDNSHLRIFLADARSQAALGQYANVGTSAAQLIELSADGAAVNGVLISMLKLVVDAWKQSEADAIEARTAGDAARRSAAEAAIAERKKLTADLVPRLAKRKEHSLAAMIFVADTAAQLEQTDTARDLYQAILTKAETDATFKQANAQALTRIQAQLVGLLRQKGQFQEGLVQVDKLIGQFPNALEPLMEKGRLLQAWADAEPARFKDAVAHWSMLRSRLARVARKPPEYYEVVYNAANCLATDSLKNNDPQKALYAEQLLNATLVLSPKLNGPEMVARYKELLQKSRQLQPNRAAGASARK